MRWIKLVRNYNYNNNKIMNKIKRLNFKCRQQPIAIIQEIASLIYLVTDSSLMSVIYIHIDSSSRLIFLVCESFLQVYCHWIIFTCIKILLDIYKLKWKCIWHASVNFQYRWVSIKSVVWGQIIQKKNDYIVWSWNNLI